MADHVKNVKISGQFVKMDWSHIAKLCEEGADSEVIKEELSKFIKKALAGRTPKVYTTDENGNRVEYVRGPSKYRKKKGLH